MYYENNCSCGYGSILIAGKTESIINFYAW